MEVEKQMLRQRRLIVQRRAVKLPVLPVISCQLKPVASVASYYIRISISIQNLSLHRTTHRRIIIEVSEVIQISKILHQNQNLLSSATVGREGGFFRVRPRRSTQSRRSGGLSIIIGTYIYDYIIIIYVYILSCPSL